jgi:hypothetical protein
MPAGTNLVERIEAEITAAFQRVEQLKTQKVEEFQGRQQRLEKFDQLLEELREVWRPRFDALA